MTSSAAAVPAPATPTPIAAEPDTWLALGELTADIVADLARAPTLSRPAHIQIGALGRARRQSRFAAADRDTVVTRRKFIVTRFIRR